MNIYHFIAVAGAAALTYATINGNYEISVQIVPPLVSAPCSFGQWWRLPNMTCAICFCMTGTLSRCLPQMGCLPSSNVTTTAPNSNGTVATTPMPMEMSSPGQEGAEGPPSSGPIDSSSSTTTTTTTTAPEEMVEGSGGGKIRSKDLFS